jgi:hypothetical protein
VGHSLNFSGNLFGVENKNFLLRHGSGFLQS